MVTSFMNCLMLAQLSIWHFLKIAVNDSTAEASCRFCGFGVLFVWLWFFFLKKNKKLVVLQWASCSGGTLCTGERKACQCSDP